MIKIQARKEKRYTDTPDGHTWDVWVDTTIQTTYIRNYEKTDRIAVGIPSEEHADKIVSEINNTVTSCVHGKL